MNHARQLEDIEEQKDKHWRESPEKGEGDEIENSCVGISLDKGTAVIFAEMTEKGLWVGIIKKKSVCVCVCVGEKWE